MWKDEFSRSARPLTSSLPVAASQADTDLDTTPLIPLPPPFPQVAREPRRDGASISLALSVSVNPSSGVSLTSLTSVTAVAAVTPDLAASPPAASPSGASHPSSLPTAPPFTSTPVTAMAPSPAAAHVPGSSMSTSPLGLPPSREAEASIRPPTERRRRAALLAYGAVGQPRSLARPSPSGAATSPSPAVPSIPPADREHATPHLRFALQPIADVSGQRVGHELLFRWNSADLPVMPTLGAYATASALCHALIDGQLLTGGWDGEPVGTLYVNMDERFLLSPMAEVLTPDLGVIELLETIVPTAEVQRRVQALHRRGYRFSLDDLETTDDPRWVLAEYVESVKIDVQAVHPEVLMPLITMARAAGLTVVAEKVECQAVIHELSALGVRLFQGWAVQRPQMQSVPALPGCHSRTLGWVQQLATQGATAEALSMIADADPALVVRLLRLQALHAPQAVALSRDLAQVIDSLPRPVLTGWLTQWLIAAQHVRGQEAVARVNRQRAVDRAQCMETGPTDGGQRREQLFSRYRALVQTF